MRFFLALTLAFFTTPATAQNHLAGEASLYLQQHVDNPVDWYPWGEEALKKAQDEQKMIFVSVGYASCHWCHVMAEESFEDDAIAAFMNEHFVNIKIDRERRPDLDEQFVLVTSALTGSAGWPNSVFLTPSGDPFYAGTYFPPADFLQLLETITEVWRDDRPALRIEAFNIASNLRNYLDQTAVLGDVSSADINAAATAMLANLDDFNGGFGQSTKFPRESMMLFLLDQATRTGDSSLLNAVTLTLDGIVKGGIHDHVGGGFHRYSVDPEWHVPHFEKMLYNQALIGRLLLRTYAATGTPDYARAASRTFDYVLRDMISPQGAFYGAQDADSLNAHGERVEGLFYIWTKEQTAQTLGADADMVNEMFGIEDEGTFEGATVLQTSNTPLVALGDLDERKFDALLAKMRTTRQTRIAPITDAKIILAWDAEMITTLAEASHVLNRPDYYHAAERAAIFLTTKMWPDTGLKRIYFDDHAAVDAQLLDYAALGHALMALHDYADGQDAKWLAMADKIAAEMKAKFWDDDQAMRMNEVAQGLGPFRPLDDNELPSANALALALFDGLDRRFARVGETAPRLAAALAIDAINSPQNRAAILTALEIQRSGSTRPMRTSNGGAVRVFSAMDRATNEITLTVKLRHGWHINAHVPLEDYLIGMELAAGDIPLPTAAYPTAEIKELGFSETPLSLYEDDFTLRIPVIVSNDDPAKVVLTLQACSEEVCLPPDEMVFWTW